MAGEKTEKATPKRRNEERKKGNVLMSREVVTVFSLLISFFALQLMAPGILTRLRRMVTDYILLAATQETIAMPDLTRFFIQGCMVFALTALPLLGIAIVINVAFTMAQTRMLFSTEALQFKWSRLNILEGMKKFVSLRSVVELSKAALKIAVLGYIIYNVLKDELLRLPRLMDMTVSQGAAFTGSLILSIVWQACIVFVILSVADYFYQWWDYERKLRMSKQEIKDEYKQLEGDPQIKGRQKAKRDQIARRRMMQNVPAADVIIRNPTHYAVAIRYDPEKHRAPVVVAKGADYLALRIIRLAEENEVYVTENRPLAKSLFERVELDQEIPETYYQAIAEVLAFVYNLRERDGKPPRPGLRPPAEALA
ncbi:MAG: flagellar biosynthesis protein FlhB [Peptococcaceae bacterium]|nr:flagellar biosynthesis protein FlhB [Peptococcaceae bacterium]